METFQLSVSEFNNICKILLSKFCTKVGDEVVVDQDYYQKIAWDDLHRALAVSPGVYISSLIDDITTLQQSLQEDFMTVVELYRLVGVFKFLALKMKYVEEHGLPLVLDEMFMQAIQENKPSFKFIKLSMHELEAICSALIFRIEKAVGEELFFDEDTYVKVCEDFIYDCYTPVTFIQRSLKNDMGEIRELIVHEQATSKDFVLFSDVLMGIANMLRYTNKSLE